MNEMTQPTDPGAVILYQCGLGCFVSDKHVDTLRKEDLVIYSSLRYLEIFWIAREVNFRRDSDGQGDCVVQARRVD